MTTKLTNLDVTEVSLVDRGAIGEVFTIIKSMDGNAELGPEEVVKLLNGMSNDNFVNIMDNMISKYNEINKGGNTNMNEELKKFVEETIGSMVTGLTETVNKNFAQINKSIDEIQKEQTSMKETMPAAMTEEEKAKKACTDQEVADMKKSLEETNKQVSELASSLETVGKALTSVEAISKSMETIAKNDQMASVTKSLEDFAKKLETFENSDNKSNVQKSNNDDNGGQKKEPFWKSVLGNPAQTE